MFDKFVILAEVGYIPLNHIDVVFMPVSFDMKYGDIGVSLFATATRGTDPAVTVGPVGPVGPIGPVTSL